MVSYSNEVQDSIYHERPCNNPLAVCAVIVRDGVNSTNKVNVVISVEDADRILAGE